MSNELDKRIGVDFRYEGGIDRWVSRVWCTAFAYLNSEHSAVTEWGGRRQMRRAIRDVERRLAKLDRAEEPRD